MSKFRKVKKHQDGDGPNLSDMTVKFQPTKAFVDAYRTAIASQVERIAGIRPEDRPRAIGITWSAVMKGGDMYARC